MPTLFADEDCNKSPSAWIYALQRSGMVGNHPIWECVGSPLSTSNTCDDWSHSVSSLYDPSRRVLRAFRWHHSRRAHKLILPTEHSPLRKQFEVLSAQWRKDTRLSS